MIKKKPVIIDTDFGGDPDDIIALFYTLNSPEIEIKAIITADEYENNHRAVVLQKWLEAGKRNIPIYSGKDLGNKNLFLLNEFYTPNKKIKNIFETNELSKILEAISTEKGYYISIGGLSNICFLITKYFSLFQDIKIFIMGGAINYRTPGRAEHNIRLDIQASKEVFNNNFKKKWILSDITFVPELKISKTHKLYKSFEGKHDFFLYLIKKNMDNFFDNKYPRSFLHDPLTVSATFMNAVVFKKEKIYFAENGEFKRSHKGREMLISKKVNYSLFWEDFNRKTLSYL